MATILNQTCPLLTLPFNADTDFNVLADHCEHFSDSMLECDDTMLKLALCGRLATCLNLLKSTLNAPIPPHLVESLAVDALPATSPRFEPDSESLCQYCQTLVQLLTEQNLSSETTPVVIELLAELVWFFAAGLKTPRWLKTEHGLKEINEKLM
ncbi:hypothetical protein J5069_22330 [Candidatus Symbiopectobacterium sp. NZEC127]|uniref:hypothetical protein n=1 Tax=Candidatus Symbiopectobacterium sp. NZEC127 TaxID=2820472 RepID=UPI002227FB4D|nr:hypothetical protein [Candidatus Symbiopectobacterium sp. NZEC127]MCW2488645.1 hypothetical protein [Candidatus Symbiopectobacterium sp. NZEC127]